MKYLFIVPVLLYTITSYANVETYPVGFKTIRYQNSKGNPWIIGIWYPAKEKGNPMSIREYITSSGIIEFTPDTTLLKEFKNVMKNWYGDSSVLQKEYEEILSKPTKAFQNTTIIDGKLPLVIGHRHTYAMIQCYEYLASRGIMVATVYSKYVKIEPFSDTLVYTPYTNELDEFADYMLANFQVDESKLAGIGHGGNIQAPFYLAMRNSKIKSLVNLDGGVFSLGSKTTINHDYAPQKLNIPMLHLITTTQKEKDNKEQFMALHNKRYQLVIKDSLVSHFFCTTWGAINHELNTKTKSGRNRLLENTNRMIEVFIKNGKLTKKEVTDDFAFTFFNE